MTIVAIEAPANRSLPGILVPVLRAALLRLDRMKQASAGVRRALRALAGFAKLKVKYDDPEVALDFEPEPGLADSGDLDADLADLTPAEKRYLQAMATLGPGPHRSGDVGEALGVKVSRVAPPRNSLITKGMFYSPAHGDTAFTVPLFDAYMSRVMPDHRDD